MIAGDLCVTEYPFRINGVDTFGDTYTHVLNTGEMFVLLSFLELDELGVLEFQILFENKKMWFNIHNNQSSIGHVRRAESYDIPFMTLQEVEPGSNSSSLIESYPPHTPSIKGYFSHFLFSVQLIKMS